MPTVTSGRGLLEAMRYTQTWSGYEQNCVLDVGVSDSRSWRVAYTYVE